jgi:hypothetical protein
MSLLPTEKMDKETPGLKPYSKKNICQHWVGLEAAVGKPELLSKLPISIIYAAICLGKLIQNGVGRRACNTTYTVDMRRLTRVGPL